MLIVNMSARRIQDKRLLSSQRWLLPPGNLGEIEHPASRCTGVGPRCSWVVVGVLVGCMYSPRVSSWLAFILPSIHVLTVGAYVAPGLAL